MELTRQASRLPLREQITPRRVWPAQLPSLISVEPCTSEVGLYPPLIHPFQADQSRVLCISPVRTL